MKVFTTESLSWIMSAITQHNNRFQDKEGEGKKEKKKERKKELVSHPCVAKLLCDNAVVSIMGAAPYIHHHWRLLSPMNLQVSQRVI